MATVVQTNTKEVAATRHPKTRNYFKVIIERALHASASLGERYSCGGEAFLVCLLLCGFHRWRVATL